MVSVSNQGGFEETRSFKSFSPGTVISHYKIIDKIGAGGMGVVYKAEDTRLKRHVALKFLPPELTRDGEAKERFTHEAQAASALDHSNICTVYEIDEAEDGQMFIAMACYEGETVKAKIKGGPLDVDEAAIIAIQIADGLKEAHEKGIVHRDIKPANLIITTKGQAKVMDFGLAKLAGQTRLTRTGTTVGTVAYMSPEQARGDEVDAGTDIWSLGVVLYEMVTGTLPFRGDYEQAVIYSILNEEPDPPTSLRADIPPRLDRIISKALTKDREERYQHIGDMLDDLRQLKGGGDRYVSTPSGSSQRPTAVHKAGGKVRLAIYSAVAVAVVVAAVVLIPHLKPSGVVLPTHRQVTFTGKAICPSISPDGNFVAYASPGSSDNRSVFVQDLSGGQPIEVFSYKAIFCMRWSPDGSELLIEAWDDSTSGTFLVPRLGGTVREFRDRPGVTWSPDGTRFAGVWASLKRAFVTNKITGDTSSVSVAGHYDWFPDVDWSPVSDLLVCHLLEGHNSRIVTVSVDQSRQHTILEDSVGIASPRWSPDGDAIYYLRAEGETVDLMKIGVSAATGRPRGDPAVVQTGLQAGDFFGISKDNRRLLYTRVQSYSNLWSVTRIGEGPGDGVESEQLTTGTLEKEDARISPDGLTVAVNVGHAAKKNIFLMPIAGGPLKQLTFSGLGVGGLAWSPDGKEIVFGALDGGKNRVWRVNSSGGTPRVFAGTVMSYGISWAPGPEILYHVPGNRNFHFLEPDTEAERALVANDSIGWMFDPIYSPDGTRIAVDWNRYPDPGIWVISLEDSSQTFVASEEFQLIEWSSDGNWIYAGKENEEWEVAEIVLIPGDGGEPRPFMKLPFDQVSDVTMTPDGEHIICDVYEYQTDVWLMENFDPEVR
jgi:serine/threonine protein kinase